MKILHVIPTFYPATYWGGPIVSTYSLCNALTQIDGIRLMVITTNAAGPECRNNVALKDISQINASYDIRYCHRVGGTSISSELLYHLIKQIKWADLVHLTAIYSFPTIPTLFLGRIYKKPIVWSPRGSLQRWKGTTKPYLKSYWETLCKAIVDSKSCCMHVTSLQEEIESKRIFPNFSYRIIPNGVEIPDIADANHPIQSNLLRILFMGRIHPKKGIENLLLGLSKVTDLYFTLTVCGSGSANYIQRIRALGAYCGIEDKIYFAGHVDGDKKKQAFVNSDVCVVPSHTENFGMVVAESLACGVPVICSKAAPWPDLDRHRCGIWTDNDPDALANAIRTINSMDLHAMGQRGRQWMAKDFSWMNIADNMYDLYHQMITKKQP